MKKEDNSGMETSFSIKKAAARCGVCTKTLKNWEKRGLIKPKKTPLGHRRYTEQMLNEVLNLKKE